jgi:hypothetical protein
MDARLATTLQEAGGMKALSLVLGTVLLLSGASVVGNALAGDKGKSTEVNPQALRDLLTNGLKATRENERLYIDLVVKLVVEKKIPVSMVYACFDYARKRYPPYPFPYFQYSLKTLAKRKNIEL